VDERKSIIARHRNARPDPTANPAWANAHHDMARLIAIDDAYEAQGTAVILAQRRKIEALERYAHHLPTCDYIVDELPCTCGLSALLKGRSQ